MGLVFLARSRLCIRALVPGVDDMAARTHFTRADAAVRSCFFRSGNNSEMVLHVS
jgi:hypothetical protein